MWPPQSLARAQCRARPILISFLKHQRLLKSVEAQDQQRSYNRVSFKRRAALLNRSGEPLRSRRLAWRWLSLALLAISIGPAVERTELNRLRFCRFKTRVQMPTRNTFRRSEEHTSELQSP